MKKYRLAALLLLAVLSLGSCELLLAWLFNPLDSISVGTGQAYLMPDEVASFDVVSSPAEAVLDLTAVTDHAPVATVTVDSAAKKITVTAHSLGTATITVTEAVYGYSATLAVTVTWDIPQTLTLDAENLSLVGGDADSLSAAIFPTQASQDVVWESSNPSVASVSAGGTVTGTGLGTATITARSAGRLEVSDACTVTVTEPAKKAGWTIMYYGDADNDLEAALIADIVEMKAGIQADADINLIVLFDRIAAYSNDDAVLNGNYTDTRLYRILPGPGAAGTAFRIPGSATRLSSISTSSTTAELNMGDVDTLAAFIDFCKEEYPASKYSLIFSNHGGGAKSADASPRSKDVCFDETSDMDPLYTAELTDGLAYRHSVDLLVYDACLMGTIEIAYQYQYMDTSHFYADYMAASAPTVWGNGLKYDAILSRIRSGGGNNGTVDLTVGDNELYLDPAAMTALQFGALIVEEQRDSTVGTDGESFALYDLSQTQAAKDAIDALAVQLVAENEKADLEALRGSGLSTLPTMHYFTNSSLDEWTAYPYFDAWDLMARVNASTAFSAEIQSLAATAALALDNLVVHSFAGSQFSGFLEGTHGISLFFPDGDALYGDTPMWAYQWWYSPIDTTTLNPDFLYGKLDWCIYGVAPRVSGDGLVVNWYEMLDAWFDTAEDLNGVPL